MLEITIPESELWDEENQSFILFKVQTLKLEHSLVSLSKWESKWCKPLLSKAEKTREETVDYIRCMTLTQNVDPIIYTFITDDQIAQVNAYINAPMTATWITERHKIINRSEQITSELIYYWMIALNIPVEFQKWHLNKLLTLIQVCNIKNQPVKKMSQSEIYEHNAALNAMRRKQNHSSG